MSWTAEQVLALAPDASSAAAGKGLAAARKWLTLGCDDRSAWGTLQGSGKTPYQTSIDFSGPAFKCSCPSRKFPCKHGLGLFLILAEHPAAFAEKVPPAWTVEWLAKRQESEEKKSAKAATPDTPQDPEAAERAAAAAAKRVASRDAKVTAGLQELGVWLEDLLRSGFATLPGKSFSFWDGPAARLVDAQAPGLARRVAALHGVTTFGERWPSILLRELALLHLAKEGWNRITTLPEPTRADLRSTIGFSTSQEEVLQQPTVRDHWMVVAQRVDENERLRTQRTWLFGTQTRRPALSLSFSAGPTQPLDISLKPGSTVDADLVFFPSAWPLRALIKNRHAVAESLGDAWPHATIAMANSFAADALTAAPWLERVPFALESVIAVKRPHGWLLRDEAGHTLSLDIPESKAWILYSLSGGRALAVAGEWDFETFRPLSVRTEGRFLRL